MARATSSLVRVLQAHGEEPESLVAGHRMYVPHGRLFYVLPQHRHVITLSPPMAMIYSCNPVSVCQALGRHASRSTELCVALLPFLRTVLEAAQSGDGFVSARKEHFRLGKAANGPFLLVPALSRIPLFVSLFHVRVTRNSDTGVRARVAPWIFRRQGGGLPSRSSFAICFVGAG